MNPYPLAPLNHFTTPCSFTNGSPYQFDTQGPTALVEEAFDLLLPQIAAGGFLFYGRKRIRMQEENRWNLSTNVEYHRRSRVFRDCQAVSLKKRETPGEEKHL